MPKFFFTKPDLRESAPALRSSIKRMSRRQQRYASRQQIQEQSADAGRRPSVLDAPCLPDRVVLRRGLWHLLRNR